MALGGFCLPDISKAVGDSTDQLVESLKGAFFSSEYGKKAAVVFFDVWVCWPVLLIGSALALVLSYVYLFVMRCLGGAIVWFMIALTEVCLIGAGIYTWFYRSKRFTEADQPYYNYLAYTSYVLWGLGALIFIFMLCCCSAIKLGIAVMKATAKFIADNLRIFVLPFISYILIFAWILFWFYGGLYLYSVGTPEQRKGFEFTTEMMWSQETKWAIVYYIFGFFWLIAFLIGSTQFIIAAAACIWYFDQGSDKKTDCVGTGIKWLFRYHLGTIALGSMIIAICQTIRVIFEYYRKKITQANPTKIVKALLCITGYLLWCLEKCIKYITKNAYIQCAVTSESFCTSAWNAFTLMIKHAARFGWGNSVGYLMIFFGCAGVGASTGFATYLFVSQQTTYFEVSSAVPASVFVGVSGVFIAWVFLSIFFFASDALLQSFLLDEELRFAGRNRPVEFAEFEQDFKRRQNSCCSCC